MTQEQCSTLAELDQLCESNLEILEGFSEQIDMIRKYGPPPELHNVIKAVCGHVCTELLRRKTVISLMNRP